MCTGQCVCISVYEMVVWWGCDCTMPSALWTSRWVGRARSLGPGLPPLGVLCSLCCSMLVQWLVSLRPISDHQLDISWSAWDQFLITSWTSPPGHVPGNAVLSIPLACLCLVHHLPHKIMALLCHLSHPCGSHPCSSLTALIQLSTDSCRSCHAFGSHSSWLPNGAGPVIVIPSLAVSRVNLRGCTVSLICSSSAYSSLVNPC